LSNNHRPGSKSRPEYNAEQAKQKNDPKEELEAVHKASGIFSVVKLINRFAHGSYPLCMIDAEWNRPSLLLLLAASV
jgi:hypothetical protein